MEIDFTSETGMLQALARDVRAKTVRLLDEAEPRELLWTPPGLGNHILWNAGHAVWVQDILCIEAITGRSELPPGWADTFSMHSRPAERTTGWPSREEVRAQLVAQAPRIIAVIAGCTRADLAGPPRTSKLGNDRRLGDWVVHASHDEANHQGEMYLLLKMLRKSRVAPPGTALA